MCLHTCCYFTKAVKHIFSRPEDTSQQGNDVQVKSLKSCYGLADYRPRTCQSPIISVVLFPSGKHLMSDSVSLLIRSGMYALIEYL